MTAKALAAKCAELGLPGLTAQALSNIESGRRGEDGRRRREVTVDELFGLAFALSVAPVHLLVPPVDGEEVVPYRVVPVGNPTTPGFARAWIRGQSPIGLTDARAYFSEVPESEWVPPAGMWTDANIERQSEAVRGQDG